MGADEESYFNWLTLVDRVSETKRVSWDDVFMMNIYEFFNIVSYNKHKDNKFKEMKERCRRNS